MSLAEAREREVHRAQIDPSYRDKRYAHGITVSEKVNRDRRIYAMRIQGHSWQSIAIAFRMSVGGVQEAARHLARCWCELYPDRGWSRHLKTCVLVSR